MEYLIEYEPLDWIYKLLIDIECNNNEVYKHAFAEKQSKINVSIILLLPLSIAYERDDVVPLLILHIVGFILSIGHNIFEPEQPKPLHSRYNAVASVASI